MTNPEPMTDEAYAKVWLAEHYSGLKMTEPQIAAMVRFCREHTTHSALCVGISLGGNLPLRNEDDTKEILQAKHNAFQERIAPGLKFGVIENVAGATGLFKLISGKWSTTGSWLPSRRKP